MERDCTRNPEDWNNKALNESAGRLFRIATQHRQNNSKSKKKRYDSELPYQRPDLIEVMEIEIDLTTY